MVNSFSKWINQNFGCEDKYTTQIDEIISSMQLDGYEIVDIKLIHYKIKVCQIYGRFPYSNIIQVRIGYL